MRHLRCIVVATLTLLISNLGFAQNETNQKKEKAREACKIAAEALESRIESYKKLLGQVKTETKKGKKLASINMKLLEKSKRLSAEPWSKKKGKCELAKANKRVTEVFKTLKKLGKSPKPPYKQFCKQQVKKLQKDIKSKQKEVMEESKKIEKEAKDVSETEAYSDSERKAAKKVSKSMEELRKLYKSLIHIEVPKRLEQKPCLRLQLMREKLRSLQDSWSIIDRYHPYTPPSLYELDNLSPPETDVPTIER
ncbi:MAG: hypothetical protein ABEJ24_03115 [Candidatus Magasanikbacteria bacterium]